MGGIDVDKYSKTSMDRLYAVGETACNGVHGKNRLASNSLLESLVFAKRAAKRMIETYSKTSDREVTIDKDLYKNYEDKYKDEILEEIERERNCLLYTSQSSFITVIAVIQTATETVPCPIISRGKVSIGFKSDDIIIRIF